MIIVSGRLYRLDWIVQTLPSKRGAKHLLCITREGSDLTVAYGRIELVASWLRGPKPLENHSDTQEHGALPRSVPRHG